MRDPGPAGKEVETVDLTDAVLVGQGTKRQVYIFPGDPSRLIKVVRPDKRDDWTRPSQKWKRFFFRSGSASVHLDELREQFALRNRGELPDILVPILGFVDTNIGIGLVVSAINNDDDTLAWDARQFIFNGGFDDEVRGALEVFFRKLADSPIVMSDITLSNISCPRIGGKLRCYLVDGYGDDSLLRLASFSARFNSFVKRRAIARCRRSIEETLALCARERAGEA